MDGFSQADRLSLHRLLHGGAVHRLVAGLNQCVRTGGWIQEGSQWTGRVVCSEDEEEEREK